MFNRKEQRIQVKRIQPNHEKHESNTENEQVKIQVSACLRGTQSCTDSLFLLFSCLAFFVFFVPFVVKMYFFVFPRLRDGFVRNKVFNKQ